MRRALQIGAIAAIFCAQAAAGNVESQLRKDYQGQLLGVRYPIHEGEQEFDAAGQPRVSAIGPWETYGGILVQKLKLSKDALRIEGPRVSLGNQVSGKWQVFRISKPLRFHLRLDYPLSSLDEARSLLERTFYLPARDFDHCKPEYRRAQTSPSADVTLDLMKGNPPYTAPKAIYTPEPEFSEEARKSKSQGRVIMSIIVDKNGTISWIRVDEAIGHGLDQNAAEAVKKWRFEPARRNGEAVSSQFTVEVDFHLY